MSDGSCCVTMVLVLAAVHTDTLGLAWYATAMWSIISDIRSSFPSTQWAPLCKYCAVSDSVLLADRMHNRPGNPRPAEGNVEAQEQWA